MAARPKGARNGHQSSDVVAVVPWVITTTGKRCRDSGRANELSYGRNPLVLLRDGGLRLRLQPALRHCRHCEEH
jgi:hypothetical protein